MAVLVTTLDNQDLQKAVKLWAKHESGIDIDPLSVSIGTRKESVGHGPAEKMVDRVDIKFTRKTNK